MPKPLVAQSWLDLKPVGEVIEGTRFVALKTPMSMEILESNHVSKDKHFTTNKLVKHIESTGKQLGIIIDLSSGSEYYNPAGLKALGVKEYVKLKTKRRTLLDGRKKFNETVKKFISKYPDQDCLIGVHCYHGLQRTSFMICSYLITELGFELDTAINAFESARGHKIENARKWLLDEFEKSE